MGAPQKPLSFCMAICSRQRPKLLAQAFDALLEMTVPDGVSLSFLLVENDDTPQYKAIVDRYSRRMPLTYVVEPEPGLSHARNKMLDAAKMLDIDWVGSIDDDAVIDPEWLVHMINAIRSYPDTHYFGGQQRRVERQDAVPWHPAYTKPVDIRTGSTRRWASTGNMAMSAMVFMDSGMGLRFDHAFRFTGGEDSDFARQYRQRGGVIRHVNEAITSEEIHIGRSDLADRLEVFASATYLSMKLHHKHDTPAIALMMSLHELYRSSVLGVANILFGAITMPFARQWGLRRYGTGLKFIARLRGLFRYYFGKSKDPYKTTYGE